MRNTIVMIACIATFLLTWLFLGLIIWLLTGDIEYRVTLGHPGMILFMITVGWLPIIPVYQDMTEIK